MKCFLGGNCTNETIDGMSIAKFLIQLKIDVNKQSASKIGSLLGSKFFKLGIRSEDQSINERIKKFNDWGVSYINKKINEIN